MSVNFNKHFEKLCVALQKNIHSDEDYAFNFSGEISTFMRFNNAKVRQIGTVNQMEVSLTMWKNLRTYSTSIMLSGDLKDDLSCINMLLDLARKQCEILPEDPFQAIATGTETSKSVYNGKLIPEKKIVSTILDPVSDLDFTGLYTQGFVCRGSANSKGAHHWFETNTFVLDFSVWLENGRAVKSCYSGREWDEGAYYDKLNTVRESLPALEQEQKVLESGKYRAFITADALAEVKEFFSWNGLGEKGMQQGESAYIPLREGRETMSPLFTLTQDFSLGGEPRFNSMGEVAPEKLVLIENGKLKNTIISSRTAKEYNLESNGGDEGEGVCSIAISGGELAEKDALEALGTGIYVSNFHYLNWSDVQNGRITGMTRFACMWVENGKIVAPIKDMRWDDSLYHMFGSKLEAVTKEQHLIPTTDTYEQRDLGNCLLPGILVSELNCTL